MSGFSSMLIEDLAPFPRSVWGRIYFAALSLVLYSTIWEKAYDAMTRHTLLARDSRFCAGRAAPVISIPSVLPRLRNTYTVCDVGHIISREDSLLLRPQRGSMPSIHKIAIWPVVLGLSQGSLEHLSLRLVRYASTACGSWTFMIQCDPAWSCMGLSFPGLQTRMSFHGMVRFTPSILGSHSTY